MLPWELVHAGSVLARFAAHKSDHCQFRAAEPLTAVLNGDNRVRNIGVAPTRNAEDGMRDVRRKCSDAESRKGFVPELLQGRAVAEDCLAGFGEAAGRVEVDSHIVVAAREVEPVRVHIAERVPTAGVGQVPEKQQRPARLVECEDSSQFRFGKITANIWQREDVKLPARQCRQRSAVDERVVKLVRLQQAHQIGGGVLR